MARRRRGVSRFYKAAAALVTVGILGVSAAACLRPERWYGICGRGHGRTVESFVEEYLRNPKLREHYPNLDTSKLELVYDIHDGHVSYTTQGKVFWTKKPLAFQTGEPFLTDGTYVIRGECCNQVSPVPRTPTLEREPSVQVVVPVYKNYIEPKISYHTNYTQPSSNYAEPKIIYTPPATPVPEPSTWVLTITGVLCVFLFRRSGVL